MKDNALLNREIGWWWSDWENNGKPIQLINCHDFAHFDQYHGPFATEDEAKEDKRLVELARGLEE